MKRWEFLSKNIPEYLTNPYIGEIVLCDETGEDAIKLKEVYGNNPKIRVFTNEKRLGAFLNKERVCRLASYPWICLIDSDNFAPLSYFQAFISYINEHGLFEKIIYAPNKGSNWVFNHFIGIPITKNNAMQIHDSFVGGPCLNIGNYIFHKSLMELPIPEGQENFPVECKAMDVFYRNYLAFRNGFVMRIIPGMEYEHVTHEGSYYTATANDIQTELFISLLRSLKDN